MGKITGLFIATIGSQSMLAQDQVTAIAGVGLEGDRYAKGIGFYSNTPTTPGARQVTLIEQEKIDLAASEIGVDVGAIETRRNLVTSGVDLKALHGRRFSVGEVVLEGVRDCPPCNHLEELTGKPLLRPLVRTGGLRARIVSGGVIRLGDEISDMGVADPPVAGRDE